MMNDLIEATLAQGEVVFSAKDVTRIAETLSRCTDCGTAESVTFEPCPYAEDIYGDSTPVWLCEPCRHERAMDI